MRVVAPRDHWCKDDLSNDCADFTARSGYAMCSGTKSSGKDFGWKNECGCVGTKVEEELAQHIQGKQSLLTQVVEVEANYRKEYCQDDESGNLDRLPSKEIDGEDCAPVSGDGASAHQDQVPDSGVVEELVHVVVTAESDSGQNR